MGLINKFWTLSTAIALVALGGSAFLNVLLFRGAKLYYLEVNAVRLDPIGLELYPSEPILPIDKQRKRVVFFGDSRAKDWPSPDLDGYEFINRGLSSQTTIQNIQRFDHHVSPLQPDIVILQVGINDLKTIALFPDRKNDIIADCQANIKSLVDASRDTGATVIITTIFPVGTVPLERKPFWSEDIEQALDDINAYLATLAGDRVFIFDTAPVLANPEGRVIKAYEKDELHLKPQAYAQLNQSLESLLESIRQ
ncbi:MAG: GDSL-type esterase/lipase family protein [Cyanobacteria bacterium P01_F01_bin.150]